MDIPFRFVDVRTIRISFRAVFHGGSSLIVRTQELNELESYRDGREQLVCF